jgi:hypothetical protein
MHLLHLPAIFPSAFTYTSSSDVKWTNLPIYGLPNLWPPYKAIIWSLITLIDGGPEDARALGLLIVRMSMTTDHKELFPDVQAITCAGD